jgi:hypothetical protein
MYQFKTCGHISSFNRTAVIEGRFECKVCAEEEFITEANNEGLILLGKTSSVQYRNYFLPCGCMKQLRLDHVRQSNWTCNTHDSTHYAKPSNLYLLKLKSKEFVCLKFGFARVVNNRVACYGLSKEVEVTVVKTIPMKTGRDALREEKNIQKICKPHKLDKNIMKPHFKWSGFNECYSVKSKEIFLKEMEKLDVKT